MTSTSFEGVDHPEVAGFVAGYEIINNDAPAARPCFQTPALWGSTHAEGREAAIFHAALDLARRHPELLSKYAATRKSENVDLKTCNIVNSSRDFQSGIHHALAEDANWLGTSVLDTTFQFEPPVNLNVSHASYTLMDAERGLIRTIASGTPNSDESNHRPARWASIIGEARSLHSSFLAKAYGSYEKTVSSAIRKARRALPVMSYRTKII